MGWKLSDNLLPSRGQHWRHCQPNPPFMSTDDRGPGPSSALRSQRSAEGPEVEPEGDGRGQRDDTPDEDRRASRLGIMTKLQKRIAQEENDASGDEKLMKPHQGGGGRKPP